MSGALFLLVFRCRFGAFFALKNVISYYIMQKSKKNAYFARFLANNGTFFRPVLGIK